MNLLKRAALLIAVLCSVSCGIEEFYYLPEAREAWITRNFNTNAEIRIPANYLNSFNYSSGYVIFYRIYLSNLSDGLLSNYASINTTLSSDYRYFEPYTDPTTTTTLEANTFRSRSYYEIEIENAAIGDTALSKNGATFTINFPAVGDLPYISYNGNDYPLLRSTGGGAFFPEPNRYFLNTDVIRDNANATSTINADVQPVSAAAFAYVSMYIAAAGQNPINFNKIYGKPAHINIFQLTRDQ